MTDTAQATGVGVTIGAATIGSVVTAHPVQIIAWITAIVVGVATLLFAIRRELREHKAEQDRIADRIKAFGDDEQS